MMRFIFIVCAVALTSLFTNTALGQNSKLSSIVDRTVIGEDETLNLTVSYEGTSGGSPDFSSLEIAFEILSRRQSSQVQTINGSISSQTSWNLLLAPRSKGKLFIPSFKFKGHFSDAIEIKVTEADQSPAGAKKSVFIETVLEKESAYVQEQVILTNRLYYSENIDALNAPDLILDNVSIQALPEVRFRRYIDGKLYIINEYKYALFPQESGELAIPAQRWTARINKSGRARSLFDLNAGRYEDRRLSTQALTINIKPRPKSFPTGATWLPAKSLKLNESWGQDPKKMTLGEPATRTLSLTAEGLMPSQLPQIIHDSDHSEFRFYIDQAKLQEQTDAEKGVISTRSESAAIVAKQAGELSLPNIRIPWWDVNSDTLRYAELPRQSLVVADIATAAHQTTTHKTMRHQTATRGQAQAASGTPSVRGTSPENDALLSGMRDQIDALQNQLFIWKILFTLFLLISIGLAVYLIRLRQNGFSHEPIRSQNTARAENEKQALKTLKHQCKGKDLSAIRIALLDWAKLHWRNESILTLTDIANRVMDPSLTAQIFALDSTLFGKVPDTNWNGQLLLSALNTYLKKHSEVTKPNESGQLSPLYP